MKKVLIQFEYKYWLQQSVTLLLLVLWTFILLFAIYNGARSVQQQKQKHIDLQSATQLKQQAHTALMDSFMAGYKIIDAIWENPTNAYMVGEEHGKRYFIKHPLPLAAFSSGQSSLHHNVQTISTSPNSWFLTMKKSEKLSNPHNSLMGKIDLSFVLLYLFPLLIIAFNFSVLSAEKEDGRLPLLLVQQLSVQQLLWYKTGFRFATVTLLTLLVTLFGYFYFQPDAQPALSDYFGYLAAMLLYSCWWHLLCIWINLYKKGSDFNAGVLFTSWLTIVIVVPALVTVIITTIKPINSKMQLMDEVRETLTAFDQQNAQILDAYYTDHPELVIKDSSQLLPVYMYKYMIKYKHTMEALQPAMINHNAQALSQAKTASYLSVLSPAMLWQETADEYSGNAQTQFLLFERQADAAVLEWNTYFTPKSLGNLPITIEEFKQLPAPVFENNIAPEKIGYLTMGSLFWIGLLLVGIYSGIKKYTLT